MNPNKNKKGNPSRAIDKLAKDSYKWLRRKITYAQMKEITTWKGLAVITFAIGVIAASMLMVYFNIQGKSKAATGGAHLTWSANSESDLAGYKIYYGTQTRNNNCPPGGYASSVDAGNVTSFDISELEEGKTYYFSTTAYDTSGNESCFSAEVSKKIPVSQFPCTVFTYSDWSECVNDTQTRTLLSSSPIGCTGGDPVLTQDCVNPAVCTSFTYSDWSECVNDTQTRTIVSSSPANCTGGNPILTQDCTSSITCTRFKYSKWGDCIDGIQTRTVDVSFPKDCTGGDPVLTQTCDNNNTTDTKKTPPGQDKKK